MNEEKKLTDEEIAKAILQSIEYSKTITYFDEWGNCKSIFVKDALDLIHRLQDENEQLKCNSYTTSWKGKFFEAKKEIDNMQDVIFALEEEKRLLKKEIETQRKVIEYQDGLPDLVEQQKAEIERLTKLYDETNSELFDRNIELEDCEKSNKSLQTMNFNLSQENAELQKQVDKLKTFIDFKTANVMCDKCKQQAVKDTAKEILAKANELWLDTINPNCLINKIEQWIKERYGVEVE